MPPMLNVSVGFPSDPASPVMVTPSRVSGGSGCTGTIERPARSLENVIEKAPVPGALFVASSASQKEIPSRPGFATRVAGDLTSQLTMSFELVTVRPIGWTVGPIGFFGSMVGFVTVKERVFELLTLEIFNR